MSLLLTLNSISAKTPENRPLFQGLSLSVRTERIGLVGRNGSGKSSLLHIIAGDLDPAGGSILRSGTIGLLAQDWPVDLNLASALGVTRDLSILQRVLAGQGSTEDFATADWALESRIGAALAEVGLAGTALDRSIGSLSGGERTRIGIARLLIDKPDLLLLDEPTNNLDAAGRAAIHGLVRDWKGGMIVASHDRELLELMDRIVELTPLGIRVVAGGWSAFAAEREAGRERAARELERSEAALRDARRSAQRRHEAQERRDRSGRVFAAKGSEPKILLGARAQRAEETSARAQRIGARETSEASARAEEARARVEVQIPVTITLPPTGLPSGVRMLSLNQMIMRRGDRSFGPWTLNVRGPERVAVTGPNGAGKTTFLKIAAGLITPTSGTVRRIEGRLLMLDQHMEILNQDTSILANFRRLNPALNEQDAYAACARFGFRNRDARQQVSTLSGGERLRAGLACTLAGERPPWLLILDEPTNHLDLESVELLEGALREYDGALIVVSHDPAFLKAVGVNRRFNVAPSQQ
jgi:ATPase subunit of ABC transporter with duplicated ATPase domains